MFIFNMIPIPPLDGSRLLYAFAPRGLRKLMSTVESYGYMAIFAIFILVYYVLSGSINYCFQHIMNLLLS
jgi:Zn-dependent protease